MIRLYLNPYRTPLTPRIDWLMYYSIPYGICNIIILVNALSKAIVDNVDKPEDHGKIRVSGCLLFFC